VISDERVLGLPFDCFLLLVYEKGKENRDGIGGFGGESQALHLSTMEHGTGDHSGPPAGRAHSKIPIFV